MFRVLILLTLVSATFGQEPVPSDGMFSFLYDVIERLVALTNGNTRQDTKIEQLEAKLEDSLRTIDELNTTLNSVRHFTGGATYVRWGKSTCPSGAQKVYDGFAAGTYYGSSGSGANFLCLPRDPIWGIFNPNLGPSGINGVDYKIGGQYEDHEAPCVVCLIPRTSVRMIPARNECYEGWNLEYRGYLVSSSYSEFRSEFICLDEDMETVRNNPETRGNGAYLYYVETRCGSLPCDVYPLGREVTCAVCSYAFRSPNV